MYCDVLAIVLNYHGATLTSRCVKSLAGQVNRICIVDNSIDFNESIELHKALDSMGSDGTDASVTIVSTGSNLGFGNGVEVGLECTDGGVQLETVLVINNDAIASDGMVKFLSEALRNHDGRALVAPGVTQGSTPSMLWYHRFFALVLKQPIPGAFPYLSGACVLVPTQLTHPYLFDPDFFMYGEDVELSWRMAKMQVPLKVVEDAKYEHVGSASSHNGSMFYEYHVARGHILLASKLAVNRLDWLWLLLGRLISLPLRASLRCLRHRSFVPLIALIRAYLNRPPASIAAIPEK